MNRNLKAYELAEAGLVVRQCVRHWHYVKGTGTVEDAMKVYRSNFYEYMTAFKTEEIARGAVQAVLDATPNVICPGCDEEAHFIRV